MRIYYLGHGNVLHEYAYPRYDSLEGKLGRLRKLKIILDPTSSITAVWHSRGSQMEIHVFYQGRCHDLLCKEFIK